MGRGGVGEGKLLTLEVGKKGIDGFLNKDVSKPLATQTWWDFMFQAHVNQNLDQTLVIQSESGQACSDPPHIQPNVSTWIEYTKRVWRAAKSVHAGMGKWEGRKIEKQEGER